MLNAPGPNADAERLQREIDALKTIVGFMLAQTRDAVFRAESLRGLLQAKGILSDQEYVLAYQAALDEWNRLTGESLTKAMQDASETALQKMLETLGGTKQ